RGAHSGYEGIVPRLQAMLDADEAPEPSDDEDDGAVGTEDLGRFVVTQTCEACHGVRLRTEALAVRLGGKNIGELSAMPLRSLRQFFVDLTESQELSHRDA